MINGAVQMMNFHALEKAADIFGNEIAILPSSIHEVILLPARDFDKEDINQIAMMVSQINRTVVSVRDFLSDHVYIYSRDTGKITIAM
jgi:hypothetical protein